MHVGFFFLETDPKIESQNPSTQTVLRLLMEIMMNLKTILRGFSPQANYTDRATAACRRS
jgi:hypothetical protein